MRQAGLFGLSAQLKRLSDGKHPRSRRSPRHQKMRHVSVAKPQTRAGKAPPERLMNNMG